jgi:hypothetical protein
MGVLAADSLMLMPPIEKVELLVVLDNVIIVKVGGQL